MLLSLQASGPQTTVPTSGERFWWMVWGTKLPLWPLQQQCQTQHSRLQQLWDGWQVASHRSAQIFITADGYGGEKYIKKNLLPPWLRGIWLNASLRCPSLPPPPPSLYQLCLCIPFSAHLFSPKQPYVYSGSLVFGSRACVSLSRGFNQRGIPGPWTDTHIHTARRTNTQARTRPQETAGCVGCMQRHLEEVKHKRERDACHSFPTRHATLHQRLITVPSAPLYWGFPQIRLSNKSRTDSLCEEYLPLLSW